MHRQKIDDQINHACGVVITCYSGVAKPSKPKRNAMKTFITSSPAGARRARSSVAAIQAARSVASAACGNAAWRWAVSVAAGVLITGGGPLGMAGCALSARGPYAEMKEQERSPLHAEKLTREAADLIGIDDAKAERLLRDALSADLYHGPAHNNLGVVFLNRGMLYEAAGEFEWARKLMAGNPDPRMNLALTLERAGHIEDAIGTYRTALEVSPEHIQTIQALTRLQCKSSKKDAKTLESLHTIALRGDSERWRDWARQMLARADRATTAMEPQESESLSR